MGLFENRAFLKLFQGYLNILCLLEIGPTENHLKTILDLFEKKNQAYLKKNNGPICKMKLGLFVR